jgi:hypothetical protein
MHASLKARPLHTVHHVCTAPTMPSAYHARAFKGTPLKHARNRAHSKQHILLPDRYPHISVQMEEQLFFNDFNGSPQ